MNHKISIIIPVYNVEEYIERCILSVIGQKYQNLEIILVDDGSADNSGVICDKYAAIDNRIKVIHQQNKGVSSARNRALDYATGDYIGFLDGDDFIHEEMYQTLYEKSITEDAVIGVCNYIKVYEETLLKDIQPGSGEVMSYIGQDALMELHKEAVLWNVVWNKLFKKELF